MWTLLLTDLECLLWLKQIVILFFFSLFLKLNFSLPAKGTDFLLSVFVMRLKLLLAIKKPYEVRLEFIDSEICESPLTCL